MLLAEVRVHSLWWPRLDFHGDTRWSNCSRFVGVWPDCSHIPNTTWDRELKIRKDNWTAKPRSLTCLYYVHLLSKFNNRFSSIEILSLSRRFQIQLLWKGKKRLGVVVAQLSERSLPPRRYAVRIQLSAKFVLNISLLPTVLKRRTRGREWPIKTILKGLEDGQHLPDEGRPHQDRRLWHLEDVDDEGGGGALGPRHPVLHQPGDVRREGLRREVRHLGFRFNEISRYFNSVWPDG